MNKVIFGILCFTTFLFCKSVDIDFAHTFLLKKDQVAEVVIVKDSEKSFEQEGNLKFRWTLLQNKRLVLLVDYEGFKRQHILQTRYGLNSIRIYLSADYKKAARRDYLVLRFKSFDAKSKKVKLDMDFVDLSKRFEIKILRPKK